MLCYSGNWKMGYKVKISNLFLTLQFFFLITIPFVFHDGLSYSILLKLSIWSQLLLLWNEVGTNWTVCCANIRRKVGVGNWCSNSNCLHGHSGTLAFALCFLLKWMCSLTTLFYLQDIARLTFIALRNEKINNKLLTFAGPRAWTTQEVGETLSRCENCKLYYNCTVQLDSYNDNGGFNYIDN